MHFFLDFSNLSKISDLSLSFDLSLFREIQAWVTGHCNRAAVSRNRYGVEKTVDTHNILIDAIQFYLCLQEI